MPFNNPQGQETVIVHQTKVFAGAAMKFQGSWTVHPKYGRQFQATIAKENKPATTAALEKYLGSGLIKGVEAKTAQKIVKHFNKDTLDIFEKDIEQLTEVPGIAQKKLDMISDVWIEHKAIREVMVLLQSHGISTLFAVKYVHPNGSHISLSAETLGKWLYRYLRCGLPGLKGKTSSDKRQTPHTRCYKGCHGPKSFALSGPSGAGKSTLIHYVLSRLDVNCYRPALVHYGGLQRNGIR